MAHLWNQICGRKLPQKNGKEHFFWFAYLVRLISCSGFYVKMLSDVHVALIYSFFYFKDWGEGGVSQSPYTVQ